MVYKFRKQHRICVETWITPSNVSVYMTDLTSVITVKIKNNNNHVQYFKISQKYTDTLDSPISWVIDWTDPPAVKMVDAVSPELGGDWGWKIQPGETKTVKFKLRAVRNSTTEPLTFAILNQASQPNSYWPIIPDLDFTLHSSGQMKLKCLIPI